MARRILLGAPSWWVRPGANVLPAFSQKYFAVYSQNDWRANSKADLNLGLRWDLQPGPTERYNRMSSVDLTAKNAFGYPGRSGVLRTWVATAAISGTRCTTTLGRESGFAYQVANNTVVRGGFGITYLPSNSGYFASPVDYGTSNFSSGTMQQPYGLSPSGVPAIHFLRQHPAEHRGGRQPGGSLRSMASAKTSSTAISRMEFRSSGTFSWRQTLLREWFVSVGYSASHSKNLMNRAYNVNSLQNIDPSVLSSGVRSTWRATG